jgi:type IV fimbrial biogenesis protein FimT
MHNSSRGITALELLVSMVLAVILTLAGAPALREYGLNQKMKSAVAMLHSDLRMARTDAISLNTWTIACPGTAVTGCARESQWAGGWLVFADMNGDRKWQATEPLLRQAMKVEGLSLLSAASRRQIRFSPGGSAPGSNASIVLCDGRGIQKGRKLVISNSGRIRQSDLESSDAKRCPSI